MPKRKACGSERNETKQKRCSLLNAEYRFLEQRLEHEGVSLSAEHAKAFVLEFKDKVRAKRGVKYSILRLCLLVVMLCKRHFERSQRQQHLLLPCSLGVHVIAQFSRLLSGAAKPFGTWSNTNSGGGWKTTVGKSNKHWRKLVDGCVHPDPLRLFSFPAEGAPFAVLLYRSACEHAPELVEEVGANCEFVLDVAPSKLDVVRSDRTKYSHTGGVQKRARTNSSISINTISNSSISDDGSGESALTVVLLDDLEYEDSKWGELLQQLIEEERVASFAIPPPGGQPDFAANQSEPAPPPQVANAAAVFVQEAGSNDWLVDASGQLQLVHLLELYMEEQFVEATPPLPLSTFEGHGWSEELLIPDGFEDIIQSLTQGVLEAEV